MASKTSKILSNIRESTSPYRCSEYDAWLQNHREGVMRSFYYIKDKLSDLPCLCGLDWDEVQRNCEEHDGSKDSIDEYLPYAVHFYGDRDNSSELLYRQAWNHHQKCNPHHSQYWVLIKDNGELEPLDIPIAYLVEMVCDWWSFAWMKGDKNEIFEWYAKEGPKKLFTDYSKSLLEEILDGLKKSLENN